MLLKGFDILTLNLIKKRLRVQCHQPTIYPEGVVSGDEGRQREGKLDIYQLSGQLAIVGHSKPKPSF